MGMIMAWVVSVRSSRRLFSAKCACRLGRLTLAVFILAALRPFSPAAQASQADAAAVIFTGSTPGPKPFIAQLQFTIAPAASLVAVDFSIQPRTGSATRPVSAGYTEQFQSDAAR